MNHDDLDARIRAALEVKHSPQQLARLEGFWQQQSRAGIRARRIRHASALVVTIAVAVVASVWLWQPEAARERLEANRPRQVVPTTPDRRHFEVHRQAVAVKPTKVPSVEPSLSAGRSPTTYERFLFSAHMHQPVVQRRPSVAAAIDQVIEQLTGDPDADAGELAETAGLTECDAERLLLRRMPRSSDDELHAIVQLLAVCGTPRSTPYLLRLSRREAFRDETLATLQRIVGLERLADFVGQTTDQRVRAALLHRLLIADSDAALRGFLRWVNDGALRAEALAAAEAADESLFPTLLGLLRDEDKAVRISAALVLGHVNGPEVTRSLIDMVTREPSGPTEAWIALLACRGEQADQFFAYATRHPLLLGHVNRARVRWTSMIP